MQQFKPLFLDSNYIGSKTNIQKCLRLNDLSEVGDGTHYLVFEMIGLFSFRELSLKQSIDFFMTFLKRLHISPDYVTIHPDKINEWSNLYQEYNIEIKEDNECKWSDGLIGGYCTEFYKNNIEIGNIVNPLGTCIDVGFGLERLLQVTNSLEYKSRLEILEDTCLTLINSGIKIGNNQQGYILKKIITECVLDGSKINHDFFNKTKENQILNYKNYLKNVNKSKHKDKDPSFWMDSFGVDVLKIEKYKKL